MATTSKSPLAVTLKQNRPFVSLQQEAFLSILRTASELSNTADKLLRQFDITQQQYNVLRILRGAGTEGLCRNEISARMVAAAPDMSRLLDRMEKSGWITRERAEDDRRQVSTFITDSGDRPESADFRAGSGERALQRFRIHHTQVCLSAGGSCSRRTGHPFAV